MVEPTEGIEIEVRKNKRYDWEAMNVGSCMKSTSPILATARSWAKRNGKNWEFASGGYRQGFYYVKRVA